ncbi:hypothetical protein FF38_01242 [Lucilia cuprina]|uniref:Uncharacterized protein n=1 Tax=Lucilia cuprina TaxID=7375 RepID=A0A0L0CC05_LUCCU|nr:hypothetical protein FF38_03290 [Lucilia cuprina]KNC29767.1 hypothetical protein FF38_01242 [Lucilia cuprina]
MTNNALHVHKTFATLSHSPTADSTDESTFCTLNDNAHIHTCTGTATIAATFPGRSSRLADERNDIQNTNPGDPRLAHLKLEISRLVNEDKVKRWLDIPLSDPEGCSRAFIEQKKGRQGGTKRCSQTSQPDSHGQPFTPAEVADVINNAKTS